MWGRGEGGRGTNKCVWGGGGDEEQTSVCVGEGGGGGGGQGCVCGGGGGGGGDEEQASVKSDILCVACGMCSAVGILCESTQNCNYFLWSYFHAELQLSSVI